MPQETHRSPRTSDQEVVDLAAALIRHPSPNPPGEERPLAEFLARWLSERGVAAEVLAVGNPGGPEANVFARIAGRGLRPPLVLCGHLDTVPAGEGAWQQDPFEPATRQGRLYGLGASDMKGAIAAMALAASRLSAESSQQPLSGDLLLAFTSGEETRSRGATAFARSGLLDGAAGLVIGEPTGNRVGIAEKGGVWLSLTLHGRTSHGSLPHLGANAISGLAAALVALEGAAAPGALSEGTSHSDAALALRRALLRPAHPLLGSPSLTATRIGGGVGNNVVPDRASAVLDIRTLPGQSGTEIRAAVERLVEEVAAPRGLRLEVADLGSRVALDVPETHPLVAATRLAVQSVLGREPEICGLTGATDATELAPVLSLPFVICGPGEMAQAHQPDEFVSVAALGEAAEIYYRLARAICG